ncbi:titin-like, partial [Contarinia nasturtii]|uniref:titin-like n=1 Tax=Contarinia nasturtii TaxID=265458 RepID=UPI0012D4ADC6
RKIKKKQGDQEQVIEVKTVEEEGKEPETIVTVEEIQPTDEEKPKKKKVIKKVKDDDYIQQLIDQDIPKTELEEFEKPEFQEIKKKPKKKKSLVPSDETPIDLVIEELPEERVTIQIPTDTGEIVEQKVTKRKIKKKQGDQEQVIEVTTVEEDGKEPETEITVEEVQPIEPTSEEQPKPKKKKVIKKVKKNEEDDIIQKLIEQEIPKTELEVFEKPEFGEIKKKKPKSKLEPIPIVKKDQKPTKLQITKVEDSPIAIKMSFKKPKPIEKKEQPLPEITGFKLKSRLVQVNYPPEATKLVIKELNTVKSNGELSRNVEEALDTLKKKKIKKIKIPKVRKDSLERPELEKYEKYESSSDESETKGKYQRGVKEGKIPEDDQKTLKLGKGKSRPADADEDTDVKLKPVPKKSQVAEEDFVEAPKKHRSEIKDQPERKTSVEIDVSKVPPFDFEPREFSEEEIPEVDKEPDVSDKESAPKKKPIKKKKVKLEPEEDKIKIKKGVPKDKDQPSEDDINLHYDRKPLPEESEEQVPLKPFERPSTKGDKPEMETQPTETTKEIPEKDYVDSDTEKQEYTETGRKTIKKIIKKPKKATPAPETSEEKETPAELLVEELPEEIITMQVPTETGEIIEQKITKRKIKKKQGDKEQVIEVKTVEEEGKEPETEITVEEIQTVEPTEKELTSEEQPKQKKKKKIIKKVKKDDYDDYIQKLIDQEIPKTELEEFEKPEFEEIKKKPKKKKSLVPKESEDQPAELVIEELPEEVVNVEIPTETGEIIEQKVTKRKIKKKQGDQEQIIEVTTVEEKGKEPETQITVEEIQPVEPTEEKPITEESTTEEQPKPKKKKKVIKKVPKDDYEDYIQKLIDQDIPKTELEEFEKPEFEEIKKKPKKKKSLVPKESEKQPAEPIVEEQVKKPKKKSLVPEVSEEQETPAELVIEELSEETVTVQIPTESGEIVEQKVTTRKIKKKQGDKEQVIEVKTVEEEGKEPETEITVEEIQPVEPTEEKPTDEESTLEEQLKPKEKKKKVIKKFKKDEQDDYIQKLIDQDIPKAELEEFEKPEFEEIKKKPKKKKKSLVPMESEEQPAELFVEELPEEVVKVEIPTETGEIVEQKVTKRKIKKKQGDQEQVIEVKTVEEEG